MFWGIFCASFKSDQSLLSLPVVKWYSLSFFTDMSIFGHYPGHDDFYLVVCSHCGQVVKPQAFEKHCERRHGSVGKLYAHLRSTPPSAQQRTHPRHGHTPPASGHGTASWSGRNQGTGGPPRPSPQSPSTPPQFRHSKTTKDAVR